MADRTQRAGGAPGRQQPPVNRPHVQRAEYIGQIGRNGSESAAVDGEGNHRRRVEQRQAAAAKYPITQIQQPELVQSDACTAHDKPAAPQTGGVTPTVRGPTLSSHFPASAAARPRNTMATEKTHTTDLMLQSSAALVTTPSSLVRAGLKMLQE